MKYENTVLGKEKKINGTPGGAQKNSRKCAKKIQGSAQDVSQKFARKPKNPAPPYQVNLVPNFKIFPGTVNWSWIFQELGNISSDAQNQN